MKEEDKYIQGNFNTDTADFIRIRLIRCTDEDYCKSEEEIKAYMRFRFLMVYMNRVRF